MSLDSNWFSEPHELAGSAISFRIKRKLALKSAGELAQYAFGLDA